MTRIIASLALLACINVAVAQDAIVGGWYYGPGYPSNNGIVITFFDNGVFYVAEDGVADAGGGPGMERGTYVFDNAAQSLVATVVDDTSGDWGLSDATVTRAEVAGDALTVRVAGESLPFSFARIVDPSQAIVGSWYTGPDYPHDDGLVLTFLAHGNYFLSEDGVADDGGMPGMERGNYSWDGANTIVFNGGGLRGKPWRDTNGDWGLSDATVLGIEVDGDRLIATVEGEGDIKFTRVPSAPVPEASTYTMLLGGLALVILALRRSRRG